ncbi:hypothetical protein WI61_25935 [Burkholderia cepacia]|nr:hypothetical protein WI61_25935 [Burkholderia cepacia]KVB98187.1 hypothetical protein WI66_12215 [Burkholderia cepacia]KVC05530.1 hypothetical protein WI68_13360 [Burkholderia cepacia]
MWLNGQDFTSIRVLHRMGGEVADRADCIQIFSDCARQLICGECGVYCGCKIAMSVAVATEHSLKASTA